MKAKSIAMLLMASLTCLGATYSSASNNESTLAKGKHLVLIGGCNDCHSAGFAESGGKLPENQWLLGNSLGFRGPWGTTYPVNLREYVSKLTEDQWVTKAKKLQARPPMPSWALNNMSKGELVAIYQYIRNLGVKASAVPAYVPPGQTPKTPYVQWPSPPKQ